MKTPPVDSHARRATIRALAAASAVLVAGRSFGQAVTTRAPACVLTPEQTEGPYFVDERLERADIRGDPADGTVRRGVPLLLALRVSAIAADGCEPLKGAIVDVWHCDAAGVYSDIDDRGSRAQGTRFLRGYQVTDSSGEVRFTTIYPGAYRGRAVHVHFKVRLPARNAGGEFTSQLYFDDALTDRVHQATPYAGRARRTRNAEDGLFRAGGRALILDAEPQGEGYAGRYDVGVQFR